MSSVDRFLQEPILPAAAAARFARDRRRVSARHHGWRRNFPAIGVLLDSDEERARALGGNFATEAREIVGAWLAARAEAAVESLPDVEEQVEWIEGFSDAWQRQVLDSEPFTALDGGERERFRATFVELMERCCTEAVAHVRIPPADERRGGAALILRPFAATARALRSFFFPRLQ